MGIKSDRYNYSSDEKVNAIALSIKMNASILFSDLKNLSHAEKLKAMQFLVAELVREEELQL